MSYNDYITLKSSPSQSIPIALDPAMDLDAIRIYSLLRHLSVEERVINIGTIEEHLDGCFAQINIKKSLIRLELYRYLSIDYKYNKRDIVIYKSINDITNNLNDSFDYHSFVKNNSQFEYKDRVYAYQTKTIIDDYLYATNSFVSVDGQNCTNGTGKINDENLAITDCKNTEANPDTTGIKNSEANPEITGLKSDGENLQTSGFKFDSENLQTSGLKSDGKNLQTSGLKPDSENLQTSGFKNIETNLAITDCKNSEVNPETTGFKNTEANPVISDNKNSADDVHKISKASLDISDNHKNTLVDSKGNENFPANSSNFSGLIASVLEKPENNPLDFDGNTQINANNSFDIKELDGFNENISKLALDKKFSAIDHIYATTVKDTTNVSKLVSNNIYNKNTYLPTNTTTAICSGILKQDTKIEVII